MAKPLWTLWKGDQQWTFATIVTARSCRQKRRTGQIEQAHPNESEAEKYRLAQAQTLIDTYGDPFDPKIMPRVLRDREKAMLGYES